MRQVVQLLAQYYVGDVSALEKLVAAVLAGGHVLFSDPPGLGKTTLAKLLARALGLSFKRVQMTPDMLPGDIIGTTVWRPNEGRFEFVRGPIFTNVLLVDEINRAPPKTQAALLEAMEERQVTVDGVTYRLEEPFVVLATQNPVEYRGVYPLPEAELDRFAVQLSLGYPDQEGEAEILRRRLAWARDDPTAYVRPVAGREDLAAWSAALERIYVDESVLRYIVALVRAVRSHPQVRLGPSPRAAIHLLKVSRAMAALDGRNYVVPDDVKAVAVEVLAHRVSGERPGREVVREALAKVTPYVRGTS